MSGFRFYIIDDNAEVWGTDDVGVAEIANKVDLSIVIDTEENKAVVGTTWDDVLEHGIVREDNDGGED